ncbi:MAG TPA: tetratricopeptide repeat protein, partial [Chloroflexota bacterium]
FIGREGVVADLRQLATQSRLLTLIGAGGVGKTRLAGVLARQMLHEYPDGVWLVELASLSRGTQIPRAIAGALSLHEQSGEPLTATIHAALERKRLLLVLDNCEHLIDDCARLAEALLRSCPHVRTLATSREPLCIPGEATFVVPPLSIPDTRRLPPLDALGELEAVRLFVERARLRQPGFALREENAAAVAQICRQVHGLPLAIELAAARIGLLSVDQIAARLSDAPAFLTSGSRTADPRQQTLRGALDWSYTLLSEPERRLLQRLSVFAGGWSLEAAEVVGAEGSDADDSILELLSRLVDKSLVVVEARPDAVIRYTMLEPIRQYAWEHLAASGDAERLERRHAALFAALADQAQVELSGAGQVSWLDRLDKEHDNIRVALRRSISHGEPEVGLRIASGIWRFWFSRGYTSEGRVWLAELFSLPGSDRVAPDIRAKGVHVSGALAYYQGDYAEALECYEAALAVRRQMDDKPAIGRLLGNMGLVVKEQGDYARAIALHEEALELSREIGDKRGLSANLNNLAIALQDQGEYERAARMHEESLALSQELGELYAVMYSLNNLGAVALEQGQYDRAVDYGEKALHLAREIGNVRSTIVALINLGLAAQEQGEYRCSWARYEEAVRLVQPIADKHQTFSCLEHLAHLARAEGQYRRAARLCGAAARIRELSGSRLERPDRPRVEATTAAARSALGDAGFEAAWSEGQELTMEEALEYALTREATAQDAPLTRREREIAGAVARGLTNRQIATELHIAERTVDTHVQHILSKLGISSRTEIPAWAIGEIAQTT